MRNRTTYEWRVNQVDEHGDINNINFFDTYAEAANFMCLEDYQEIELTKIIGNNDDGIVDRAYAAVDFDLWELPETFDDGSKIPAAKRTEVRKWHKKEWPVTLKFRNALEWRMAPLVKSGEYKVERVEPKDHQDRVYEIIDYYIHVATGLCGARARWWADGSEYLASINSGLAKRIFSAS